jgi:hypothetical protein
MKPATGCHVAVPVWELDDERHRGRQGLLGYSALIGGGVEMVGAGPLWEDADVKETTYLYLGTLG